MDKKIEHTGVVGMKWGIRNSRSSISSSGKAAVQKTTQPGIRKRSREELKQIHDARMKIVKEKVDSFLGKEIGLTKLSDLKHMPREKAIQHVTTVALATYGAIKLGEFFAKKMIGS